MGIQSEFRDTFLSQPPSFKKKKEYTLHKELGRGGFGKVIKATWKPATGDQREVALKIIRKERIAKDADVWAEIKVLKGLEHPNIVHVWDHFESRDKYYLTFELATGGELFDRIATKGRFTEQDAANCIRQVLSATAYLHSHNIMHRDLKPENILFINENPDSPIVLADFGIAKVLEHADDECDDQAGSLAYAAPEVLRQFSYGLKVDVWSIGVIAYMTLCGYEPFRGFSAGELVADIMRGKLRFHERYWSRISSTARDFCRALLVVSPARRLSAQEALNHPWIGGDVQSEHDLSTSIVDNFNARAKWSKAFTAITAANKFRSAPNSSPSSPTSPTTPSPFTAMPPAQPSSAEPPAVESSTSGTVTPLSVTDEEDDDGQASYFTASERESIGPATPARVRVYHDPALRNKASVDSLNAGIKLSEEGRPGEPAIVEDKIGERSGETEKIGKAKVPEDSPTRVGLGGLKSMIGRLGL